MSIEEYLQQEFGHPFTPSQQRAAYVLARFVATRVEDACLILRGYAGTGKTSLVAALVRLLQQMQRPVVLLAPTGRAAKVLSRWAGAPAYTIHRFIYRQQAFRGEDTRFNLGYNTLRDAIFIVDEASMLPQGVGGGSGSVFAEGYVLDDLVRFVYNERGNRILFVGDAAQLPPVGEEQSAALVRRVMEGYGLRVAEVDLTDVVRQDEASSVLEAATDLRQRLRDDTANALTLRTPLGKDITWVSGEDFVEALISAYDREGEDEVVVIVRTNRQAVQYNNGIRARVLYCEDLLTCGDRLMVAKNNYHWLNPTGEEERSSHFAFIANGDVCNVIRLANVHEQYGFLFADATLRFPDYDEEVECRLLLSTLQSESGALTREESQRLFEAVQEDYAHIPLKADRMKAIRQDAYYNALQVKYAYAITCHKAQGGQWRNVFVDAGYVPEEAQGAPLIRWLYTAFTRTSDHLFLVNFPRDEED